MKLAIGVDTGGTYTDAVLYDFDSKKILKKAKSLTTKDDLCIGISNALQGLNAQTFEGVSMVSLSTTLATNACVENKGGLAKLIFFGGDKEIIQKHGAKYGLPPASEIYIPDCKTTLDGQIVTEPDWQEFKQNIPQFIKGADGVGVIELYSMRNNAVIEKKAKDLILEHTSTPVTCGYELFNELNSLQRGAGTLLNAQLYPVIFEFIKAVKKVMNQLKIDAPIAIMRSDGSLMSEQFAYTHPVETLLCGPSASVMGALSLTDTKDAIVVDMGGTTTDIAILKNTIPVRATEGVAIGKWRTFVNGLMIRTFGLGGDSAIRYKNRKLILEDFRVIPLCVLAEDYPFVTEHLKSLISQEKTVHSQFKYEFFVLAKQPENDKTFTADEQKLLCALKEKPLSREDAALAMGRDVYTFNADRLIKEGYVQICGLTPTDIMHVRNDFNKFDAKASKLGAQIVADNLAISVEKLCEIVYTEIVHKMYINIAKIILQNQDGFYKKGEFGKETEHFIEECYQTAIGNSRGIAQATLTTNFKLIGIGAPIKLYLNEVARLFKTDAIIPESAEVANAVGAVSGTVFASAIAEIRYKVGEGYVVYGNESSNMFETLEEAQEFAIKDASARAQKNAIERGALGDISLNPTIKHSTVQEYDDVEPIYLSTTITVDAVGSIGWKN